MKTDNTTGKKEKITSNVDKMKEITTKQQAKKEKPRTINSSSDVAVTNDIEQESMQMIITDTSITNQNGVQNIISDETIIIKPKHKTLTFQEDPMQFHAKPRDLAKNALKRPREMDTNIVLTNPIFSRVSFSALPLDVRLSGLLEKSTAEVCILFYFILFYFIGLDYTELDWIGLYWIGLDWIGLDYIGLD